MAAHNPTAVSKLKQKQSSQLHSYVHFVSFKQRNDASSCVNVGTAALNDGHKWVGMRARFRPPRHHTYCLAIPTIPLTIQPAPSYSR